MGWGGHDKVVVVGMVGRLAPPWQKLLYACGKGWWVCVGCFMWRLAVCAETALPAWKQHGCFHTIRFGFGPSPGVGITPPTHTHTLYLNFSLTGTFITQYDVLSAAHCVFDSLAGVIFTDWSFQPGKQGRTAPYGTFPYLYVNFYRVEYPR